MSKYLVNLKNEENPGLHISCSHVFVVTGENMAEAKNKVVDKSKKDGFYGLKNYWQANIIKLKSGGHQHIFTCMTQNNKELDTIISLTDKPRPEPQETYADYLARL